MSSLAKQDLSGLKVIVCVSAWLSIWRIVGVRSYWERQRIFSRLAHSRCRELVGEGIFSRPGAPFIYRLNLGFSFFLFFPFSSKHNINPGFFAFIFYHFLCIIIIYFIQNDPFSSKSPLNFPLNLWYEQGLISSSVFRPHLFQRDYISSYDHYNHSANRFC